MELVQLDLYLPPSKPQAGYRFPRSTQIRPEGWRGVPAGWCQMGQQEVTFETQYTNFCAFLYISARKLTRYLTDASLISTSGMRSLPPVVPSSGAVQQLYWVPMVNMPQPPTDTHTHTHLCVPG